MWLFGLYDYGTCQMWKRARNIMHCIEKSCMIGWNQTVSLSGGISCSALWKWSNGCRGYVDHEQLGSNSYFHTYLCGQQEFFSNLQFLKKIQKFPGLFVAGVKIWHKKNTAPDCKRNHQCFFLDKNIWNFFFPSVKWTIIYFLEIFTKYFFSKRLRRKPLETTWVNFDPEAPT